jgi:hypothetical protein
VDQLDYVALALRAEERAEVADSSDIADCWRRLAETYWLLAGHLAKKDRRSTQPANRKSKDDTASGDGTTPDMVGK